MRHNAKPGKARPFLLLMRLAASLTASTPMPGLALADPAGSVALWAASPQSPNTPGPGTPVTLNDQTIREVVRLSAAGTGLRVRLTNLFTGAPTAIGEVRAARSGANGAADNAIVPGTDRGVTFGGKTSFILAAHAGALSDPVDLPVGALQSLAVSIYVSRGTAPATPHLIGQQTATIVPGDQTGAASLASGSVTTQSRYLLCGIEAVEPGGATIVTLGDSITDGLHATIDANRRWPDLLADRLQRTPLRRLAVANEGIAGNRLLSNGVGPAALSRLDRDVLSRPGLRFVTLLEGINDIGLGTTRDDIVAAYRQIIARAHQRGVLVFGCTLTPFQGALYATEGGESTRAAVNEFIRHGRAFDGVIDFDAALRDPRDERALRPAYDSGDHLHPNDAGYAAMAQAVPLHLFMK